jgi:hypothetical protein
MIVSTGSPLGHVGATMLPGGDFVISYQEGIGSGKAELYLRRVSPTGGMTAPYQVPDSDGLFAFSVPQIASAGDDLVIVWTKQVDNEYSIQSAVIDVSHLGALQ